MVFDFCIWILAFRVQLWLGLFSFLFLVRIIHAIRSFNSKLYTIDVHDAENLCNITTNSLLARTYTDASAKARAYEERRRKIWPSANN